MSSVALGSGSLTTEQLEWLRVKKGYKVPETPLSELLSSRPSKRHAEYTDSESSESESDEESDRRSRKRKVRRHH